MGTRALSLTTVDSHPWMLRAEEVEQREEVRGKKARASCVKWGWRERRKETRRSEQGARPSPEGKGRGRGEVCASSSPHRDLIAVRPSVHPSVHRVYIVMSSKKTAKKRKEGGAGSEAKRSRGPLGWECPICTFDNAVESFKCAMCDTRKGTSTRKPRLSSSLQEQHQTVHNFVLQQQAEAAAKAKAREAAARPLPLRRE